MKKIIALLLCALCLCGCAHSAPPAAPVTEPPTDPVTEAPLVSVTIYHGNANADGFETTAFETEEITADVLMEKLIEVGVLDAAVVLNAMEDRGGRLELDFNSAFADQINTMGTAGERMMMGSVVNTFLMAFDAGTVSVRVDGQILETGHVIYDEPMGFFE